MFKKENVGELTGLTVSNTTIISAGTTIKGDLKSENAMRIDGKIYGDISCSEKIIIGPEGIVEGEIISTQAIIMGRVLGNITTRESLVLSGKARIDGHLYTRMLTIEPEVIFNGQCHMDASPEELNLKLPNLSKISNLAVSDSN